MIDTLLRMVRVEGSHVRLMACCRDSYGAVIGDFREHDFQVIHKSHHPKHGSSIRHKILQGFVATQLRVILPIKFNHLELHLLLDEGKHSSGLRLLCPLPHDSDLESTNN